MRLLFDPWGDMGEWSQLRSWARLLFYAQLGEWSAWVAAAQKF